MRYSDTMIRLINWYRVDNSLPTLTPNESLMNAARKQSDYMYKISTLTHTGKDNSHISDRAVSAGYPYIEIAENIAFASIKPMDVLGLWIRSQPHKEILLNPAHRDIGIGLTPEHGNPKDGDVQYYWTAVLGCPLTAS